MKTPTRLHCISARSLANKPKNMTTPEEVKDRVAVKRGYKDWHELLSYGGNSMQFVKDCENQAMRDYAEACGKNRFHDLDHEIISLRGKISELEKKIEKAGSELPSYKSYMKWVESNMGANTDADFYDWMKEQASVVIAKKDNDLVKVLAKHCSEHLDYEKKLEHKDKEIEELKRTQRTLMPRINPNII